MEGVLQKGTIVLVQNMSMPCIDRDFNSNYVDLDLSRDTISKFLNMNAHFESVDLDDTTSQGRETAMHFTLAGMRTGVLSCGRTS
jgi:hypothetical protein